MPESYPLYSDPIDYDSFPDVDLTLDEHWIVADGARHGLGERMSQKTTQAKLPGGGKAAEGPLSWDAQLRDCSLAHAEDRAAQGCDLNAVVSADCPAPGRFKAAPAGRSPGSLPESPPTLSLAATTNSRLIIRLSKG